MGNYLSLLTPTTRSHQRLKPTLLAVLLMYGGLVVAHALWSMNTDPVQNFADTLDITAATLFTCAGVLQISGSHISRTPRASVLGAALVVFGVMTFPLTYAVDLLHQSQPAFMPAPALRVLTVLVTLSLVAVAVWSPSRTQRLSAGRIIGTALSCAAVVIVALFLLRVHLDPSVHTQTFLKVGTSVACLCLAAVLAERGRRNPDEATPGLITVLCAIAVIGLLQAGAMQNFGFLALASSLSVLVGLTVLATAAVELFEAATCEQVARRLVTEKLDSAEGLLTEGGEWREEMTHDARNAITAIRMASTLLYDSRDELDATASERLGAAVLAEISHLEHVIAPSGRVPSMEFDLEAAIRPVVDLQLAAGLAVELHLGGLWARGRPADLATVVQNLLVNARTHAGDRPVTILGRHNGSRVELLVQDRGPGLGTTDLEAIFARGGRGAASEGSGLGLHVSRSLMRQQGGELRLHETSSQGTTFLLSLQHASDLLGPRHRGAAGTAGTPRTKQSLVGRPAPAWTS
jgi:signal transduction histidine kinase